MSKEWTPEKYQDTVKALFKRASTDEAFRKRCLADPVGSIKEISGLDLPAGAKMRFVEKLEEHVLVLPLLMSSELSDNELAAVAGGAIDRSTELCYVWSMDPTDWVYRCADNFP